MLQQIGFNLPGRISRVDFLVRRDIGKTELEQNRLRLRRPDKSSVKCERKLDQMLKVSKCQEI